MCPVFTSNAQTRRFERHKVDLPVRVIVDASEKTRILDARGNDVSRRGMCVRAGLELARLNLAFTRIAAPIDGRIGRSNAAAGNLVRDADVLATIYALDPLYVVFDLDDTGSFVGQTVSARSCLTRSSCTRTISAFGVRPRVLLNCRSSALQESDTWVRTSSTEIPSQAWSRMKSNAFATSGFSIANTSVERRLTMPIGSI